MKKGRLYVVGMPIGHPEDLSPRAVEVLGSVDYVACKDVRSAQRTLSQRNIEKDLVEVSESSEREAAEQIVLDLAMGKSVALISDGGMPGVADPGAHLLAEVLDTGIRVSAVPGPVSLTTALAVCGIDARRFYYYGYLSPKRPERVQELRAIRDFPDPVVFLDAPHRLFPLLEDLTAAFGSGRPAAVAIELTRKGEDIRRGTLEQLRDYYGTHKRKCDFVIIVEAAPRSHRSRGRR